MNEQHVREAIAIMKRAKNFDIRDWQDSDYGFEITTEKELHKCGTAACFAGHVAVSPEWLKNDGYGVGIGGMPCIKNSIPNLGLAGSDAIAHWLDVDYDFSIFLCGLHGSRLFYGVDYLSQVTKEMVIEKLEGLLIDEGVVL